MLLYVLCTLTGLGLGVASLVAMALATGAMVEIGNCVSDPRIQVLRPCPDHLGRLFLVLLGGIATLMVGQVIYAMRAAPTGAWGRGPNWGTFWWPALFVLGALMFHDIAGKDDIFRPEEAQFMFWMMTGFAGLFVVIGLGPVVFRPALTWKLLFGGDGADGATLLGAGGPDGRLRITLVTPGGRRQAAFGPGASATAEPPAAHVPGSTDLAGQLERLAALHRTGVLSDAEFAKAKDALLSRDNR